MFTGRHFGPLAAVPLCLLGGCLLALLSVAASRPGRPVVVRPGGRVSGTALLRRPGFPRRHRVGAAAAVAPPTQAGR